MTCRFIVVCLLVAIGFSSPLQAEMRNSTNDPEIMEFFKKHPDADTDLDGVLADFEYAAMKAGEIEGDFKFIMVPLRDGTGLATDIYLPAGEGPFPVVLCRTPYGRGREQGTATRALAEGCVLIAQDVRGDGGSEGEEIRESDSFYNEIQDSYDVIEWIAEQPWSNGKIAMTGGSGRGLSACMALWSQAPHLTAVMPGNTAGNPYMYWGFKNKVATFQRKWFSSASRQWSKKKPTLPQDFNDGEWREQITAKAPDIKPLFFNASGWYDPLVESTLDDFSLLYPYGKAFAKIEGRGHGGRVNFNFAEGDRTFPQGNLYEPGVEWPQIYQVLKEEKTFNGGQSALRYFLMGDVLDPDAPGNCFITTHQWPVPHTEKSFYLASDSKLSDKPSSDGTCTFPYDPNNPAPTIGGHWTWNADQCGPKDQRPLHDRQDVLLFTTEPLTEPVTITGMLKMNLYVSTDVPDTLFVVKVVDIYPNGYEALICETPYMLRYRDGLDTSAPAEPGEVYKLDFNLRPTAIAFNKGHKIGVIITSSSSPAFEVHPNSYEEVTNFSGPYEQVSSYPDAPVANNTVYFSKKYPSCVILPVIEN